ncbi:MAG: DNA-processing protein DprA [Caldisericia bacterium]|nr:DNA-processing protein DprA [Caldisericia bacterium]
MDNKEILNKISDLFLRFTYNLYISRKIKYSQYNEIWEKDFSLIPEKFLQILSSQSTDNFVNEELQRAKSLNVNVVPFNHDDYPESLKFLKGMPPVLYTKGKLKLNNFGNCAIIGSRKASPYGKKYAFRFSADLARNGLTIVSGMAYGIDSEAHKGALSVNGKTVAVFGTGVDVCYPKSHRTLMNRISSEGLLVSEFPLGENPRPYYFPARNRIISGLSDAVLVLEAAIKSGAMITADLAIDQGKEVFALPGSIDSETCMGTNTLLKNGVRVLTESQDVMSLPCFKSVVKTNVSTASNNFTEIENTVLDMLRANDLNFNDIIEGSSRNTQEVMQALTLLELKGTIKKNGSKYSLYQSIF